MTATAMTCLHLQLAAWIAYCRALPSPIDACSTTEEVYNCHAEHDLPAMQYYFLQFNGEKQPTERRLSYFPHPYPSIKDLQKEIVR
jgi:hypothetical protein